MVEQEQADGETIRVKNCVAECDIGSRMIAVYQRCQDQCHQEF